MFQNKNENDSPQKISTKDFEQENELIHVHTMQQDIAEENDPELAKRNIDDQETPIFKKSVPFSQLSETQKSSPFLSPAPEPIENHDPVKEVDDNTTGEKTATKKGVLNFVFLGLFIALIAIGGYFFWVSRQQKAPIAEEVILEEPKEEPVVVQKEEPKTEPTATFSIDKPNLVSIDIESITQEETMNILKKYASEVVVSKISVPIEFSIVDKQNNPIKFSDFSKLLKISLPPKTTLQLSDAFSLFIYSDQGQPRFGFSLETKSALIKNTLAKEESLLIDSLYPILSEVPFVRPTKIAFGKSVYNSLEIHYLNLSDSQTQPLSIDYAISGTKLLIGTTKMTMRSIIDRINITKTENSPETITQSKAEK